MNNKLRTALEVIGVLLLMVTVCGLCGSLSMTGGNTEVVEVQAECPVCPQNEKEVVEVYKDNPATLEQLQAHKKVACAYTAMYPVMMDMVEIVVEDYGLWDMMTQDLYNLNTMSKEYQAEHCK
jgi:hypothetical protein